MTGTALLAGEALADSELLAYVLKVFQMCPPLYADPGENYWRHGFESPGSFLSGSGGMPSGHTIGAFSVATIVARRYRNHRWVPFSSATDWRCSWAFPGTWSEHFLADVFVGGAPGYPVSRFAVLQQ